MDKKFIVIYRYYKDFDIVLERLRLIRLIDPNIEIYGMYGGGEDTFPDAQEYFSEYFVHNYLLKADNDKWKWLHGDIFYKMWYNDIGKNIDFDFVVIMEWDLLFLEKIENLFPEMDRNEIRVTGLIPLDKVSKYWYWTNESNYNNYKTFLTTVENQFGKPVKEYAMLGPGVCFSKDFLHDLSEMDLFGLGVNDELKMPVWSQVLDYKISSNNFYRNWFSFYELQYFNCNNLDISLKTITKQLSKRDGRRVFHPVRYNFNGEELFSKYMHSVEKYGNSINNKKQKVTSISKWYMYSLHCKLTKLKYNKKTLNNY